LIVDLAADQPFGIGLRLNDDGVAIGKDHLIFWGTGDSPETT